MQTPSEMGADAWSLTYCETFFLFETYKFPFMLYISISYNS